MILMIFYYLFYCKDYMLLFILMEFYSLWIIWILIQTKKYNLMLYYFMYSAISSLFIIISFIFYYLQFNINLLQIIITIAFNIKIGLMPFHMLYMLLYSYLNWNNLLIVNMMPKIFMLIILNKVNLLYNKLFFMSNCINYLFITFSNLYTNNFKKMLMLSSFSNLSLLMMYLLYNYKSIYIWIILLLYIFNNIPIFKLMSNNWYYNPIINLLMMFNMFSLIGIPPLIGFYYKWLIMNNCFNLLILSLILMNSLLSIFYYLKFIKFYNTIYYINSNISYIAMLMSLMNMFMYILM